MQYQLLPTLNRKRTSKFVSSLRIRGDLPPYWKLHVHLWFGVVDPYQTRSLLSINVHENGWTLDIISEMSLMGKVCIMPSNWVFLNFHFATKRLRVVALVQEAAKKVDLWFVASQAQSTVDIGKPENAHITLYIDSWSAVPRWRY